MAAKSHRALKITGIVIGVIVGIALIAVVALNIYMRVAFAPFFDRAESPFDIPGINTGFVPQDLDHVEADDSWLFSGYMADHSPSPLYRRTADGTITKFYVSLPDGSPYDGHGSAITTNEQYAYLACEESYLVIPMDDLLFAEDGASVQATEKVDVDLSPAFMNIEQGQLLLGNFYYPNDTRRRRTTTSPRRTAPRTPRSCTPSPPILQSRAVSSPCPTTCSPFPAWSRAPVSPTTDASCCRSPMASRPRTCSPTT